MVTVYFPSLCIMAVAQVNKCIANYLNFKVFFWKTLYFKSEHFKTSIPVAITAMLVMYTLNRTVSKMLRQTYMVKFIDVWIIYGLFIHFFILVLLILIEHLPNNQNVVFIESSKNVQAPRTHKSLQDMTQIFAQKLLPTIQILFVICYMVCACVIYNMDSD